MELPTPHGAVAAVATFVRDRLSDVGDTLAPLFARREDTDPAVADERAGSGARQLATVIVAATAPFAQTSYGRARLLRQMHASGLLTERETERALAACASERSA
jgi:hypothetical protein